MAASHRLAAFPLVAFSVVASLAGEFVHQHHELVL